MDFELIVKYTQYETENLSTYQKVSRRKIVTVIFCSGASSLSSTEGRQSLENIFVINRKANELEICKVSQSITFHHFSFLLSHIN